MAHKRDKIKLSELDLQESVIKINRVNKVVKGGRTLSFNALVVVGDPANHVVGFGFGKAKEVPQAVQKANNNARKNLVKIPVVRGTVPHEGEYKEKGSVVMICRAGRGTGIKAGGGMRAVFEKAGIENVLAKSKGSANPYTVVKATINGLKSKRTAHEIAKARGITVEQVYNG